MKEDPELGKQLSEVEEKQNRWLGRRIEAQDARGTSKPEEEQAPVSSAPAATTPIEYELEQLPIGFQMGPSGQGGGRAYCRDAGRVRSTF